MPARPLFFAAFTLVALAGCAPQADEVGSTFRDGDRTVAVERTGPAASDSAGTMLTPVELQWEDAADVVRAHVDRTAIVKLEKDFDPADLHVAGARVVSPLMSSIGLWLVEDSTGGDGVDLASRLDGPDGRARGITSAIPNLYVRMRAFDAFTPNDPRFGGQWYFDGLGMPEAWGLTKGDASHSIVIVDTGCDLQHVDLVGKLDPGRDVVDDDDDPSFDAGAAGAAHGTACAGIAAASTDNAEGIAGGCPECRLRCVRLLTDAPQPLSTTVEAFDFALEVDASVVSNSWGYVDPMPVPESIAAAITNVHVTGRGGKGALILFAAGNDDREIGDDELQAVEGVFTIGAINHFDEQTPFTNYGNAVDLVAPTGTLTTDITGAGGDDPSDYTESFGGTSSACPVAAGIAGLLVSAAPDRTAAELYDIMIQTARPAPYAVPDATGHDPVYGYGIIDPVTALQSALGIGGAPTTSSTGAGAGGISTPASSPTEDESGCSCSTPGSSSRPAPILLGILLAASAWARRRRSPR